MPYLRGRIRGKSYKPRSGFFFLCCSLIFLIPGSAYASAGSFSVTGVVPLLPGYARLVAKHSSIEKEGDQFVVLLRESLETPVRNRTVVVNVETFGEGAYTREVVLKTDLSGKAVLPAQGNEDGVFSVVRCEAAFPSGSVSIDAVYRDISLEFGTSGFGGVPLLVLLGRSLYTKRWTTKYEAKTQNSREERAKKTNT